MTADEITDVQIRELQQLLIGLRQNAYTRSIIKDCQGALNGSWACRESVATAWDKCFKVPE